MLLAALLPLLTAAAASTDTLNSPALTSISGCAGFAYGLLSIGYYHYPCFGVLPWLGWS